MCLFYLQGIAKPAVVPVWQALLPVGWREIFKNYNYSFVLKNRFDGDIPVSQLKRNDEPKLIWKSDNRQSLAELFVGFLKFFAKDFR